MEWPQSQAGAPNDPEMTRISLPPDPRQGYLSHMNRRSTARTSLLAVVFATGAILVSCGGGSGGSSPMSEAEFCAQAEALDNSDGDITPEAVSQLADMAKRAPTEELRNAMGVLLPAWQKMLDTDLNDAEAFAALMEEFNTDEINAAGQVLDDYSTNVCGVGADDGDSDGDTMGDSTDEDSGTGFDIDAYNDIDTSEFSDKIDELVPLYGDGASLNSAQMSALYPGAELIATFDAEGDGLAFCNALLDWVSTQTEDTNVIIRVYAGDIETVSRMADSDCMEL